jgi:hypothetical protein
MAAGLQIFDAFGNTVLDATYRVLRIAGSRYLDGTTSSLVDDRLSQGGFVSFQPDISCGDGYLSGGVIVPVFSISGSTLSWYYAPKNSATNDVFQTGTLFYGAG